MNARAVGKLSEYSDALYVISNYVSDCLNYNVLGSVIRSFALNGVKKHTLDLWTAPRVFINYSGRTLKILRLTRHLMVLKYCSENKLPVNKRYAAQVKDRYLCYLRGTIEKPNR